MHIPLAGRTMDELSATLWTGRCVSMRSYVRAIKTCKVSAPDARFNIGRGEEATAQEILWHYRRMLDRTITERGAAAA